MRIRIGKIMRRAAIIAGLILLTALAALTADTPAQRLFDRLRGKVLDDMVKVPRYTCVETVTRHQYRPQVPLRATTCAGVITARAALTSPGVLTWHDRLRLDVAVGADSEMFSWAGARAFDTKDLDTLTASGSSGSGDFASFLGSVFGGAAEHFVYQGEKDTPLGRLTMFEYNVPLAKSHYSYRTGNGAKGITGYHGAFYAIPATAELRRLVVEATEFASGNVCRVLDTMDYQRAKIGSGDYILPEVSRMEVLYTDGEESQNETHYSGCHEFTGESTIRFDDPDEPNSAAAEAKAELQALPPKTHIRVRIDPPIDSLIAAAGDPITGVVESEVKQKGKVLVRTSDRLHGRVLRLEQFMFPDPHWLVAIRFDSIERDGVEQPVSLKPADDGDRTGQRVQQTPGLGRRGAPTMSTAAALPTPERPPGGGVFILPGTGNLVLDRKFHSEWETK